MKRLLLPLQKWLPGKVGGGGGKILEGEHQPPVWTHTDSPVQGSSVGNFAPLLVEEGDQLVIAVGPLSIHNQQVIGGYHADHVQPVRGRHVPSDGNIPQPALQSDCTDEISIVRCV